MNVNFLKSPTAAGAVTLASFAASAQHIVSVVNETNPLAVSLVYPIGIDGLLYVGIRAMQTGRKKVGAVALLVGAAYSLLFNADAENAIKMDPLLIAASMPICFLAAILIESTAKQAEEIEVPAAAPQIVTKTVAPALLPIVPFVKPLPAPAPRWVHAGIRHTLPIVPLAAPAAAPKPKPAPRPETKTDAPKTEAKPSAGRVASWDVEKAVRLHADGRTDEDVLLLVDGLTAKPWQRTKRAIKIMTQDASTTDESVSEIVGQSAAHVARVRAAMKESK